MVQHLPIPCARGSAEAAGAVVCGPGPSATTVAPRSARLLLAGAVLGSGLAFIDGSAVNLTLPIIEQQLGGDLATAQWIMNAYALTLGALVLAGGAAADRYGRKRVFLIGVALFAGASLACGAAANLPFLIIARAIQGCAAALLTPASLALLGATFEAEARSRAIGIWAGASGLMSALGPVLGGWLASTLTWRAVFLINLPLAVLAILLVRAGGRESRGAQAGPVDLAGAVVVTASLAAITWGLTEAPKRGLFEPLVAGALMAGVLGLGLFIWVERRAASPMAPLRLFRSRTFSGLNAYTLALYGGFGGAIFLLPFLLLRVHHYPPAAAGAALLPLSLGLAVLSPMAGWLAHRVGAKSLLVMGPGFAAVGFVVMAWRASDPAYWTGAFPGLVLLALGMGLAVAPLTDSILAAVGAAYEGAASGINNAVARLAGLLAVALVGFVLSGPEAAGVLAGYRMALAAAAVAAAAAAVIALLTVGGRKARDAGR